MKRVFVNGYGSIGSRLASFLLDDPELEVTGVGKQSPDSKVAEAAARGIDVYVPESRLPDFDGHGGVRGTIKSALAKSDIVIDASPGGCGYANKTSLYEPGGIPAIYQGGESIEGPEAVSDLLFNSRTNYDRAINARHVMQGSCNVTGMGRMLVPLRNAYGDGISRIDVTLIRRWADIEQADKEVPDTIEMTEAPHHGRDVMATFGAGGSGDGRGGAAPPPPPPQLHVRAVKVPTRQMHLHVMDVRFSREAAESGAMPDAAELHGLLEREPGIAILRRAKGTAEIRECAKKMGFSFVDTNLVHVHANMTEVRGDTIQVMYSDDQTGIVIPENHMLLQAMVMGRPYEEAAAHTEKVFHMAEKKRILQETFA